MPFESETAASEVVADSETTAGDRASSDQNPAPPARPVWWQRRDGLVFWAVCIFASLPLALSYWIGLLGDIRYSFLPLPFVVTGYLCWARSEGRPTFPRSIAGWLLVSAAALCLVLGVLQGFSWLGAVAFVLFVAGGLSTIRGVLRRSLVGLVAPLLSFLIPTGLADLVTAWLYRTTAWFSSIFLDYFKLPHSVSGSVIRLFESEVVVSQICGGFTSLSFLLFVAFTMMAWKRISLWLLPFYCVAAIAVAISVNSLRVVFSVIAADSMESDLSVGWYPTVLSLAAACVSVGLIYSFHHLLAILFHHVEPNNEVGSNPLVQAWNRFSWMNENRAMEERAIAGRYEDDAFTGVEPSPKLWYGLAGVSLLLFALSTTTVLTTSGPVSELASSTKPLVQMTETFFDQVDADDSFVLERFVSDQSPDEAVRVSRASGQSIDRWIGKYRKGKLTLQIVQPVAGWIEITRGYQRAGWELIDRDTDSIQGAFGSGQAGNVNDAKDGSSRTDELTDDSVTDDAGRTSETLSAFATARLRSGSGDGLEGYLFYSAVNRSGQVVETPTAVTSMWNSLLRRLGIGDQDDVQSVAMVQVFVASPQRLSPGEIRLLKREYVKHRDAVAQAIAGEDFN